jgi:flagellar biogenesis protein FliO
MARRLDSAGMKARHDSGTAAGPRAPFRSIATIAGLSGLLIVAAVGAFGPKQAAAGSAPEATNRVLTATADVGSALGSADVTGGLNVMDLALKGILVVILLFFTLRVLGKLQGTGIKKAGRLQVLESRSLAQKASLHLVAIGDRRLVVGLTPSGMVSLAELDAAELDAATETEAAALADASATGSETAGAGSLGDLVPPAFGSVLASMTGPIDAVTNRLAGLLSGGRAR